MSISEEEFKKMFDLVRELQENYTKNIEKENENLRNMLADAQRRLDEALATIEKMKSGNNEEALKKWREMQEMMDGTKIWTSPATVPYTPTIYPNEPYKVTWTTSSDTTQPCTSDSYNKFRAYMSSKMQAKADEDG